jgi:ABC-2 type transport system ATP-binding protein
MSIKVEGVSKVYGTQRALNNVSFEVNSGEIVGFLGPNGAGKSTMMKILTCFIPQTEGLAEVCGFNVEDNPMEVKKSIGYLPESNPLYYDMYVKEYLHFIAGLHQIEEPKKKVDEIISLVGLDIEQHKQIGELSKGYKQRVGLAQALIHNPEVLILDEPTTGLDPNQIVDIRNLIKEIGKTKTVLMSTHIMQEVEAICDRVIIINHGKIVADDKTSNLKNILKDQHIVVVEFKENVEVSLLKNIVGVKSVHLHEDNSFHLVPDNGKDIRESVFKFAVEHKLSIISLKEEEKRLEEVFKSLTAN